MRALFEGGYNSSSEGKRCGYNLRAGTIKGRVQLKALRYTVMQFSSFTQRIHILKEFSEKFFKSSLYPNITNLLSSEVGW